MCGRYALFSDPAKIAGKLGLPPPPTDWQLGYNIVPGTAITTEPARGPAGSIHARMPLVLDDSCLKKWLDPQLQDREALRQSMDRLEPDSLDCWPVSTAVNRTGNDRPGLVEPLAQ